MILLAPGLDLARPGSGARTAVLPPRADGIDLLVAAIQQAVQRWRSAGARALAAARYRRGSARRLRQRHDVPGASSGHDQGTRSRAADVGPPAIDAGNFHRDAAAKVASRPGVSTSRPGVARGDRAGCAMADRVGRNASPSSADCIASRSSRPPSTTSTTSPWTRIDLKLSLPSGRAFLAQIAGRTDGARPARPRPVRVLAAPEGGARSRSGSSAVRTALNAEFDAVFLRLNPGEFNAEDRAGLAGEAGAATPGDLRRATQIFETYVR